MYINLRVQDLGLKAQGFMISLGADLLALNCRVSVSIPETRYLSQQLLKHGP